MKPTPFLRVQVGGIFNDIDGTTFIKTGKVYIKRESDYQEVNCVILKPYKQKDQRGMIKFKEDDVYCELLDDSEIAELVILDANHIDETEER